MSGRGCKESIVSGREHGGTRYEARGEVDGVASAALGKKASGLPTPKATTRVAMGTRMYNTYVPNKTISVPDDVLPIIDSLGVPFSTWVADQLRHHAATHSGLGFSQQLLTDAGLAGSKPPTRAESSEALERMERSAPW